VSLFLILVPVAVAFAIAFWMVGGGALNFLVKYIVFVAVILSMYWVSFGLFGTILPAIVDGDLRYRVIDGIKKAPSMTLRLLFGPVFVGLISIVLALGFTTATYGILPEGARMLIFSLISATLGLCNIALATATLCPVYRMIVPAPDSSVAE
jgi:hypothetical protein